MNIHVYTVKQLRPRIIRAIKNGNNERKYIEEACNAEYSWPHFNEAVKNVRGAEDSMNQLSLFG